MHIGKTLHRVASAGLIVLTAIGIMGSTLTAQAASATDPTVTQQATHQYDAGEYTRDYKFNDYLTSNVTDYDAYRTWVSRNVADNLPVVGGFNGLCTYMLKQAADGHWLAGRNLDTGGVMPSIRVRTHPSGGYASVGNAFVMKASNTGEPSTTELKASALAAPYFTADGVNEKGVSAALLALNNFSAPTDSSKRTINQFALVRLVLDHASSVTEAEQLIRRFNIAPFSASGKTSTYGLHLAVADRTGDLAVFEWQNGGLHVTHPAAGSQIVVNTATWTGAAAKDSRFVKARNYLDQMTGSAATKDNLLRVMHQLPSSTPIQWSVVYDLNDTTGIQTNRGNTDGSYGSTQSFSLDGTTYDLWFGDSQMYGYGIKDDATRATKRFSHLVSEADNATDVNVSVSGTNWTGTGSNRFGNQVDRLITDYEGKNVKRVVGQGVHNDAQVSPAISAKSTDAELKAKAQIIADTAKPYYAKLRQAFPNAQLVYIPQVTVWGAAQKSNTFFAAILKTGAYLVDDLKQQGWAVMDMNTDLNLIGDHQDYLADSIHVNEKGHAAAAQGIVKWLNTTDVPVSGDVPSGTVKATFDPNGGTGTISPVTFTPGQTVTVPGGDGFTRAGWTFSGWNTKADGSGIKLSAGQSVTTPTSTTDFVLYAQWTRNADDMHTVTFDANGGSTVAKQTVKNGSKATKPADPTRNGFTFTGWTLNGKTYDFTQPVTGDITLVAQWKANTSKPTQSGANVKVDATGRTNEYRVSLSVQGSGSSETTRTPTDYIVLIDESGSMSNTDATGTKRSEYVRRALNQLASGVLTTQNSNRPATQRDRIAVLHSSQDNSRLQNGVEWHDKASDIQSMTVSEAGDTPWATWLAAMHKQLTLGRSNAQKVGILITDGSPSAGWGDQRTWEDSDGEYDSNTELTATNMGQNDRRNEYTRSLKQAERLAKDGWTAFYNIGVDIDSQKCDGNIASGNTDERKMVCLTPQGVDFPKSEYDRTGSNNGYYDYVYWPKTGKVASNDSVAAKLDRSAFDSPLEGLTRKMTGSGMNAHISTVSGSGLTDAINQTLKDVTVIHTMRDLTGTIPLSEWMNPVGLTDGKGDGITVTRDGKALTSGYTARYDGKTRKVSTLFSGDLADGATYTFSFLVRISDAGAASGKMTLPTAVGNKSYVAWTDVTSTDGKETTTSKTDPDVVVPEAKVLSPTVNGLPGTGSNRSMVAVLAASGGLLAILGLGAALAYRRTRTE